MNTPKDIYAHVAICGACETTVVSFETITAEGSPPGSERDLERLHSSSVVGKSVREAIEYHYPVDDPRWALVLGRRYYDVQDVE